MPEFEPIDTDERELVGGPEMELPGVPVRRWPWALGFAGLLLAATVTVILQRSGDRPSEADRPVPTQTAAVSLRPEATPPPLPTVKSPIRLVESPVTLDLPGNVTSFDIAPDGYAAAIASACDTLSSCSTALATRHDGEAWTRRSLPPGATDGPLLWSLGDGVLVVEQYADQPADQRRWRSGDGGRSWREVSTTPVRPAPDTTGGTLVVTGGSHVPGCGGQGLAVLRRDGRTAPLRWPPDLAPCQASAYPDPGGRLWVGGMDPDSHRPEIAVSYDSGATWRTMPLRGIGGAADWVVLSLAGTDVYATVFGRLNESPVRFGVQAIFWYDFYTWRRTASYEGQEREANGMIACPRGMLLAVQQQQKAFDREHQMVSYDRGRTWAIADTEMLVTGNQPTSPYADHAYYGWWYAPRGSQGVVRSTDCRTWHTLGVR